MNRLLPPICLVVALAMLITGFALWAVEPAEPVAELSRARATGNDRFGDVLEAQQERRLLARQVLIGCLFVGSGLMVVTAFLVMRPSH